jgi:hypothetical protein
MSIRMRHKLWRQMMTKTRPHQTREHWPALFERKAMVASSSCVDHPKYQALRFPTSGCAECLAIYGEVHKK